MIYSTVGILERSSVFFKNGKYTITYDIADLVDFIDDFELEDDGSNISFNLNM